MSSSDTAVARVAPSEHDLLTVARGLVGQISPVAVQGLLRRQRELPPRICSTATGLLADTLAKGLVLQLCRRGGWRSVEQLTADGNIATGRLWHRHPDPPWLHLSPLAVRLCRWLVSEPLRRTAADLSCNSGEPTPADEVLLYLACDLARQVGCGVAVAATRAVQASPLCWIGFFDLLADVGATPPPTGGFDALTAGDSAVLLEALQADLARRWVEIETAKRRLVDPTDVIVLGGTQEALIDAFCAALERAARPDLAAFLIDAAGSILASRPSASAWIGQLSRAASLADRQQAGFAAAALLRGMERIDVWARRAAAVRFFDDEYEASQLLLRIWQRLGPDGSQRARLLASQLSSPRALASHPTTSEDR